MYSAVILDHFKNPRHAGELADATAAVDVSNPVCGDLVHLSARVEAGQIVAVRFKAQGCVTAMACASLLTELLAGRSTEEVKKITAAQISEACGGLPPATFHGAQLAADALSALLVQCACLS